MIGLLQGKQREKSLGSWWTQPSLPAHKGSWDVVFSSLSHENNDPPLPSTAAPPTDVMREAFSGSGHFLSLGLLLISLFREHILFSSLSYFFSSEIVLISDQ